jgi:hypothetical protein
MGRLKIWKNKGWPVESKLDVDKLLKQKKKDAENVGMKEKTMVINLDDQLIRLAIDVGPLNLKEMRH